MSRDELTAAERTVLGHLDETALVESLMELVRIPSMGGTDAGGGVRGAAAGLRRTLAADVARWDIDLDEITGAPWSPGAGVPRERAVGVVGPSPGQDADAPPALVLQGH